MPWCHYTCLISIWDTKCRKTKMNYIFRVNHTNIFCSISLKDNSSGITKYSQGGKNESYKVEELLVHNNQAARPGPMHGSSHSVGRINNHRIIIFTIKFLREKFPQKQIQCRVDIIQFWIPKFQKHLYILHSNYMLYRKASGLTFLENSKNYPKYYFASNGCFSNNIFLCLTYMGYSV